MARRLIRIDESVLQDLKGALSSFLIRGELVALYRLFQGHLHETYVAEWRVSDQGEQRRFIHQRINQDAFPNTESMLRNTAALVQFLHNSSDNPFPAKLELIESEDKKPFVAVDGDLWRTYSFVEGSTSYDICPDLRKAENLGQACGDFLSVLKDFQCQKLITHSPEFHDSQRRWRDLCECVASLSPHAMSELSESLFSEMEELCEAACSVSKQLTSGAIRTQAIHGDTKVNNFLFEEEGDRVLCLVDLDLCMEGTPLYDFGDLVRSGSAVGREDEPNLEKVGVNREILAALTRGFLSSRFVLTEEEKRLLPLAPFAISFNLSTRFLKDHLSGDVYFPVDRPGHNLDRATAQWKVTKHLYTSREVIEGILLSVAPVGAE